MRGKKYFAITVVAVLILAIFTACGEQKDIGRDAALEKAITEAGVEETDATRLKISEDTENGKKVYEIQFDVDGKAYEYEVQASDGVIVSSSIESILPAQNGSGDTGEQTSDQTSGQTAGNSVGNTGSTGGNSATTAVAISWEQAAAIVLERVPGATRNDLKMELDYDDGQYLYEGDIIYQQREYEFEIDANSGTILEWSEERR